MQNGTIQLDRVGLISLSLPNDYFGSHLDDHTCTINDYFDISMFEFARKVLPEI